MGLGGQLHAPAALTPGKNTGSHIKKAGCAPRPVWMGTEKCLGKRPLKQGPFNGQGF